MNREDIIRVMREACDTDMVFAWHNDFWTVTQEELERFAALVAAHTLANTSPPQRKNRHVSYVCPQCHYSLDEREPLTDAEMRECAQSMDAEPLAEGWKELIKFARAIERAHGIGGSDE